ncbi:MAG: hypothetical protein QXN26_06580 [Thermoplasmataceae archaeon]
MIIEGLLLENDTAAYFPLDRDLKNMLVMPEAVLLELGAMASVLAVDCVIWLLNSEYGIR